MYQDVKAPLTYTKHCTRAGEMIEYDRDRRLHHLIGKCFDDGKL